MSPADTRGFEDRLRAGMRQAAGSVGAPLDFDTRVRRRITRGRRSRTVSLVAASTAVAMVVAAGIWQVEAHHRNVGVVIEPATAATTIPPPPGPMADAWKPLPPAPIPPRMEDLTLWTGTVMLVWGGVNGSNQNFGSGATYNPESGQWQVLPPAPISPRAGPVGVWTGTEALIYGGDGPGGTTPADGAAYDPSTQTWRHLAPAPLGNLGDSANYVVWTGKVMLAWGFREPSGATIPPIGIFNPTANQWTTGAAAPVSPPISGDAFWTGTELIVVGAGSPPSTQTPSPLVAVAYNPTTNTWRQLPPSPISYGRQQMMAAWDGTELIIGGGYGYVYDPGPHADAAAYNPTANTWRRLPNAPEDYTATTFDGDRYTNLWDGLDIVILQDSDPKGRPLLLNPTTGTWGFGPPQPVPGRGDTPAIWTGRQIIEWAGGTVHPTSYGQSAANTVGGGTTLTFGN